MLAVSPCATTMGVPPSGDQFPCGAETVRGAADATGAGETTGAGDELTPDGGASGCDSMCVLLATFWRGAIEPTGLRSTGALALAKGFEKGSESRVASEQPVRRAAVAVARNGVKVFPEVMIPLVATLKEMANQGAIVRRVAEEVFKEKGTKIEYMVGTMIELPRAALVADEIAKEAEFFSFGTNDLTQTTFGFSRDDVNKVLPTYLAEGILKQDPFAALDQEGVGQLVKMVTERGRKTRPTLKVGICGEHGGEPSSVEFCYKTGLNYVSCSPFRVLTARLAAAQAAAAETLKVEGGRTK